MDANRDGNNLPKGLKSLGISSYKVLVSYKQWEKIINNNIVDNDTEFIIEGQPKASTNVKKKPYITINCMRIQIKQQKIEQNICDNKSIVVEQVDKKRS